MTKAIAMLGAPASGKSTLLAPYRSSLLQVGEFVKVLPERHPLKQACASYWLQCVPFGPELLNEILSKMQIPETEYDY